MHRLLTRTVTLTLAVGLVLPAEQMAAQNAAAQEAAAQEAETSDAGAPADSIEERNKALARGFYEDLWFSDNRDRELPGHSMER